MGKKTVRIPVVEFARKTSPVEFAGHGVVKRRGVIFRSGIYEHQNFAMSPDELRALAGSFSGPIKIDHGHPTADGPIDFGYLESVETSPDGTTLYGTTVTPAWLDKALGDARWLVSASFDRATKAIRRLSLVTRPQITDAELQAAFACACEAHTAREEISKMPTKKELARKAIDAMADDDPALDVLTDPRWESPDPEEESVADDDGVDRDSEGFLAAEPARAQAEFADQAARIEWLEAKDRRRDAEVFVDAAIKDDLVLPAERNRLVARHAQFALDDEQSPAQFADGKPLSRVAEFQADIRARRPHGHTRQWAGDPEFSGDRTLENGPPRQETDREYAARIVAKHNGRNRIGGSAR